MGTLFVAAQIQKFVTITANAFLPEPELAASNPKTVDLEIPEDLLDYIDTL